MGRAAAATGFRGGRCLWLAAAAMLAGCGGDEAEQTGAPGTVHATVLDASTNAAVPNSVVAIEAGTIYAQNPDRTKGNPSYTWGARAGDDGAFEIQLPAADEHGFHVFAAGYRYGPQRVEVKSDTTAEIEILLEPEGAADVEPAISDVALAPATAAPGSAFEVSATVAAGDDEQPSKISEEVLLISPDLQSSVALDPPAPGCELAPLGCPNGLFSRTLTAPETAGSYRYYFVVSTEGCVTSDPMELELVVE